MSYNINIAGHIEGIVGDELTKAEHEIARKSHDFINSLPGVNTASFGGQHYTHHDLRKMPIDPIFAPRAAPEKQI